MILIMGILAALTILSGQVYTTQLTPAVEVSQEDTSSSDTEHQQTIVKAVDAVSTSANVSLTHHFYFINEILHIEENHEESTFFELPKLSTFFTTLFRQIISPNAP
jgi:hypothetical protein